MIRYKTTETTCEQVKVGELFSTGGPEYWNHVDPLAIGQKVYIRTDAPCPPHDVGQPIFIIEVEEVPDAPD